MRAFPKPLRRERECADTIQIPRGNYAEMKLALLEAIVGEQGSIRRAARVLGVPRSTLGTWLRRGGQNDGTKEAEAGTRIGSPAKRL